MQRLDLTLATPQENLACDEALLEMCESGFEAEILRLWEPRQNFVTLGYANKIASESDPDFCRARGIPILRRCSGGGAVLQGPGCLNYSLILKVDHGPYRSITEANRHIMRRHGEILEKILGSPVNIQGATDLTLGSLKFSGNAQRRKKHFLLFHGTFLLQIDWDLMERTLRPPSKQPAYRQNRGHREFLTTLPVNSSVIKHSLQEAWNAHQALQNFPWPLIHQLVRDKYSRAEWNERF